MGRDRLTLLAMIAPLGVVFASFFLLPLARLFAIGGSGPEGIFAYTAIVTNPRYFGSLITTVALAAAVTAATLVISGISGVFLQRNSFPGDSLLISLLTLPLAFPGVVIAFMVIMFAGRQGLIGDISRLFSDERLVFAYSLAGVIAGYIYFSIPRTILTIMAAAEKLDPALEEAARSLGAGTWRVICDVIIPGLKPALISASAIGFATAMGAFGTVYALGVRVDVLPMVIYTEFTVQANIAMAAALSFVLGAVTWIALALARTAAGSTVAAAG